MGHNPKTRRGSKPSVRKGHPWKEILIGGGIVAAIVTLIGTIGVQWLHDWWYRPQIEVWYSQLALGAKGIQHGDDVKDYAFLLDEIENCTLVSYTLHGKTTDTKVWNSPVEGIIKLYVFNSGRSPVTNVSFAVNPWSTQWIGAESSSNLSIVTSTSTSTSSGILTHTVTIRSIPPGSSGLITLKAWLNGTALTPVPGKGDGYFLWLGFPLNSNFLYQGSNELNGSEMPHPRPEKAITLLQRESELAGDGKIHVPFVDDAGLTASSPQIIKWQSPPTFQGVGICPLSPEVREKFVFTPLIQIVPSEKNSNGHPKN
jgi:hypothetical protein